MLLHREVELNFSSKSLRCFQAMLGILLIYEAISLWPFKEVFFSIIPPLGAQIDANLLGFILVVMALSGTLMAIGRLGSLSSVFGWVCMVILAKCNPVILTGADIMLICLLLWHVILKAGENEVRSGKRRGDWLFAAYIAFVCIIYWTSGFHKTSPAWRIDGSALAAILRTPSLQTMFTPWLLSLGPGILSFLSHLSLFLEQFGPALLLIGWKHVVLRHVVILAFMSFHLLGILPFLNIGHFPFVCFTLWLPLVSDEAWHAIMTMTRRISTSLPIASVSLNGLKNLSSNFHFTFAFAAAWYLVICGALAALGVDPERSLVVKRFTNLARHTEAYTQWAFFCPGPSPSDGWLIGSWRTEDGRIVNINCVGKTISQEFGTEQKPIPYPDHRWRSLISHLCRYPRSVIAENYYDWLWKKLPYDRNQRVDFEVYWYEINTSRDDKDAIKKKMLYKYDSNHHGKSSR